MGDIMKFLKYQLNTDIRESADIDNAGLQQI